MLSRDAGKGVGIDLLKGGSMGQALQSRNDEWNGYGVRRIERISDFCEINPIGNLYI